MKIRGVSQERYEKYKEKIICSLCKKNFKPSKSWQIDHCRSNRPIYCSKSCAEFVSKQSSRNNMVKTNKKHASGRMKIKNPMYKDEFLNKMIETKTKNKTLKICPIIRGGNGNELPIPVKLLNEKLNWETTYIVRTGQRGIYPTHYKLEIANPEKKIAIELDGSSYYSRKEIAKKKEDFLKSLGWNILRFKNREVLENLDKVAEICLNMANK